MAFKCDNCGYKTNEVKTGGEIAKKGKRIAIKILTREDLCRDVLKSESAGVFIPEVSLELSAGTLGGKFTTVEGLLSLARDNLKESNPFAVGDSSTETAKTKYTEFIAHLDKIIAGEEPFTFILDDPLGNSYVQSLYAPDPDPSMVEEEYDRTFEQNEEFGLNDMKTEGYEEEEVQQKSNTTTQDQINNEN